MKEAMRVRNLTAGLLAVAVCTAVAPAQQPESRLIDTQPRVVMGPTGSWDHAELDLDLEIEERRRARDRSSEGSSWIAAAAFVSAGGAFLLLAWAVRRRER
jgi:hypothetical protein